MQELLDSVNSLSSKERKALAVLLKRQGINLYGVVPIPPRAPGEPLALSYAQQRQWFLWQLEPESAAYNMPTALRLKGALDIEALRTSFETLIARHETLRTTFRQEGGQAIQVIHPRIDVAWVQEELDAANAVLIQSKIKEEAAKPFDLERGPLLRVKLLRLAVDDHVLVVTMHHIVSDGWSAPIMVDELVQLYEGYCVGQVLSLPELPIQYADYAIWQRQWMEAGEQERQLAYWKAQLGDEQPVLELPTDRPRPAIQSQAGAGMTIELNDELAKSLKQLAQQQGTTLFMLLLASFQSLLHRYSGQDDIRVGVPIANRNRVETERLIGFFVNTQVLKAKFDLRTTFSELLKQIQQTALAAQAHQDLPFEQLVEALHPERSLSHSPLFQVMYNHQSQVKGGSRHLPGLEIEGLTLESSTTKFDLALDTFEHEHGIGVSLSYATALFERPTIERMASHWINLLEGIVKAPNQRISELPMLSDAESRTILKKWENTQADYPSSRYVHQLIEDRVRQAPEAVAVLFNDQQLTYLQLDVQANRLAHKLIELGVGPEVRVAIAMRRSEEIMVAFLAVLKAGGAYVPLDVAYPRERLLYMMKDCAAALVLTQSDMLEQLPIPEGLPTLAVDQAVAWRSYPSTTPEVDLAEENLAYVIYTSGSTGQPKGVAVSHGPLVSHIRATGERYETNPSDCELHFMSFAFDGAHEGWMHPLINGARVLIREDSLWLPEQTYAEMHRHGVTIGVFPPVYLQQLAEHAERVGNPPPVRVYCFGGDAVPQASYDLAWRALRPQYLFNGYGPTETVVTPLLWKARPDDACGASYAPIGTLLGKRRGYVLDADLNLLPVGLPGELYLGGEGVARGYLDRPGLTAERFVPDPFGGNGERVYRSGDLTRARADGLVDYLGRVDHQVKVRGFRIELGEIEARLLEQEAVREAVVLAHEGVSGKQLVGYVVPAGFVSQSEAQAALRETLRSALKANLPDYMLPAHLLFLEKLPLTPNGKLDRKALPQPDARQMQRAYVAPRTDLEQRIASVWSGVLKVERVGLNDNFFELGGHSLLATQVVSRIRQQLNIDLPLRSLFEAQDLADFSLLAGHGSADKQPRLERTTRGQTVVLSYAQQRQWFLWQLEPESAAYHIPTALRLKGRLDLEALRRSFETLIARHETLRTTFREEGDQAIQVIHADVPFELAHEEPESVSESAIRACVEAEIRRPFSLERGPLLRVKLLRLAEDEHVLVLTLHHIVSDGWSMPIMVDELVQLYAGYSEGHDVALPDLPIQYADYTLWQRSWMQAGERERQLTYWQEQLGGEQPVLELPSDRPRPVVQSYVGASLDIELDGVLVQSLKSLAQQQGVTMFMLLLASFQILLHRYSGQSDIRVGVPIANRTRVETEGLIGFFVNTQVLKAEFDLATTFGGLLQQVKRIALEAQAHQDLPFEQLVEALQPERSLSHSPLFQAMYNHQREAKGGARQLPGLRVEGLDWKSHVAQFDLVLDTFESGTGLWASLTYATDLFDHPTVERLVGHWRNLLESICTQPWVRIAELPMLGTEERERITQEWARIPGDYSGDVCVHALIETQAARAPKSVALVFGDRTMTYRELNRRANRLAHLLIERGVGPEGRVGIAVERNLDMVVGLLAILKAGGAYVPLDPQYPRERLSYMLEDSGVRWLLTQRSLEGAFPVPSSVQCVFLDLESEGYAEQNPVSHVQSESLAYTIYTSGSTGRPKGVNVAHAALAAHCRVAISYFRLVPEDRVLLFSTLNFDGFIEQLFPALCQGAGVVIRGNEIWDSATFHREVLRSGITVADLSTAYWYLLVQDYAQQRPGDFGALRQVSVTGEAMSSEGIALWKQAGLESVRLLNTYGPTETTITASYLECAPYLDDKSPKPALMPIGRPLGGRTMFILGSAFEPVSQGVISELFIGGELLARGYHNRPSLTAERFLPDPFDERGGGRLYRTGDLTRYRGDGLIEYVGRVDHQVKIRGFRVEMGEIEARLLEQEMVREAVVVAQEGAIGKQLVGYVVPAEHVPVEAQGGLREVLKRVLKDKLPEYMVPAYLMLLNRLPLTPGGKLDRQALPQPDAGQLQKSYVAPETEMEKRIAAIWAEVLNAERVGLTDNFFELGGDSILSLQVVSRARREGIRFTAKALFQHQTVQRLASVARLSDGLSDKQGPLFGAVELTPIQQWFFETEMPARHHWNQSVLLEPRNALDAHYLGEALQAVVAHHDTLRLRFEQRDGAWRAEYRAMEPAELLWTCDLADLQALGPIADEAQRSLSLENGPMLRAVLANFSDGGQRLLLVAHHLVVDGVSWRILLEDLQRSYEALAMGQPLMLPGKSSSFKTWAKYLHAIASGSTLAQELTFWREQLQGTTDRMPFDNPNGGRHQKHLVFAGASLDKDRTRRLLQEAPVACQSRINDLLLAALARVLCRWTQQPSVLVRMEGHGREELCADIDLSRTVGWFTTMYPVKLTTHSTWRESVIAIRERLKAIPNQGIGYGVLRYFGEPYIREEIRQLPWGNIIFNYLGQFDQTFDMETGLLIPAKEGGGAGRDDNAPLDGIISINGMVYAGELKFSWGFSQEMFQYQTIQRLADEYIEEFRCLIEDIT